MAELFRIFNWIATAVFDALFWPLSSFPRAALAWVSILVGVALLLLFGRLSNQDGLRRVKERIKAHFLELWLYRDDIRVTCRSVSAILGCNVRYLGYSLFPMLVLAPLVAIALVQIGIRYEWRPLRIGETTVLRVILQDGVPVAELRLDLPAGVALDAPPVRIPRLGEVAWRLRATSAGDHAMRLSAGGVNAEKRVTVSGDGGTAALPVLRSTSLADLALFPAEAPAPAPFRRLEVQYPRASFCLGSWALPWWLAFLVLSLLAGLGLKGVFGVEV